MQSKQKINVDISRDRNLSEPSVYAKQNDSNSRKVEVTLFDSGIQLSSLTAPGKVFFGKGDNAYVETIQITNGVTEFIIPQNALSSSGRIQAEILILNDTDTETLTSATFIINCHAQINPSGAITGENNGDILGQILERIEQIESSEMARTPLPDGAIDLNTLTSSAWWYTAEQRIDITNTPVELAELELIVTRDAISITQILIASDGGVGIYLRFSHDSGRNWTNWQKIATDTDISVLNETLRRIDDALDSKVSSVNGKNGSVTVTGDDILVSEYKQETLASKILDNSDRIENLEDNLKRYTNFKVASRSDGAPVKYAKLGTYQCRYRGDRVTLTINGGILKPDSSVTGEIGKNGGIKILTLGRAYTYSGDPIKGVFYNFDCGNNQTDDIDILIVSQKGYSADIVDVYIAFNDEFLNKETGWFDFFVTAEEYIYVGAGEENSSPKIGWDTNIGYIFPDGTDPTIDASWYTIVPKATIKDTTIITDEIENINTSFENINISISQINEKLDGIEDDANKTIVDSELSATSTNPIQNKAVAEQFEILTNKFIEVDDELEAKVSSVNGKNGTVTVTGADIPLEEGSQTLIGPYVNSINSSVLQMNDNLDKKVSLTNGTIQGSANWNNLTKTGCYKIQNCTMTADYNAPVDEYKYGVLQVLNSENETGEYRVTQIYIPHRHMLKYGIHIRSNNSATGYNDWTDWVGFYSAKQVDLKLETKASVETGICTLTVSNGSVSNASYSKTGKDVTVNFWFYPDDTNEVVVSGLPYVATKNQSGIASASVGGVRVSYEMSKDNANATLYPETTSEQYCTLTYNLGAYNPQP